MDSHNGGNTPDLAVKEALLNRYSIDTMYTCGEYQGGDTVVTRWAEAAAGNLVSGWTFIVLLCHPSNFEQFRVTPGHLE